MLSFEGLLVILGPAVGIAFALGVLLGLVL